MGEKKRSTMNNVFFSSILGDNEKSSQWGYVLDWLFNDRKFEGWTSAEISQYTKEIKKNELFITDKFQKGSSKNLIFPSRPAKSFIIIIQGKSETKDLLRHIRNGIAHGNAYLKKRNTWIEIKDYFTKEPKGQSAYIMMPIKLLFDMHYQFGKRGKTGNEYSNYKM